MARRYELSEEDWRRVEPLLPPRTTRRGGRRFRDHRRVLDGVLWVLHTGAQRRGGRCPAATARGAPPTGGTPAGRRTGRRTASFGRFGWSWMRTGWSTTSCGSPTAPASAPAEARPAQKRGGRTERAAGPRARPQPGRLRYQGAPADRRQRVAAGGDAHGRAGPREHAARGVAGAGTGRGSPASAEAGRRQGVQLPAGATAAVVAGRQAGDPASPGPGRQVGPPGVLQARQLSPPQRRRNAAERCVGWLKGERRVGTRQDKLATRFFGFVQLAMMRRLRNTT